MNFTDFIENKGSKEQFLGKIICPLYLSPQQRFPYLNFFIYQYATAKETLHMEQDYRLKIRLFWITWMSQG